MDFRQGADPNLRSHLYEYLLYRAVDTTKERTGRGIRVSEVAAIRDEMSERLPQTESGTFDGQAIKSPQEFGMALDQIMGQRVEGYEPLFTTPVFYREAMHDFTTAAGFSSDSPGKLGPRLLVSPYDPRYRNNIVAMCAGTRLMAVPDETIVQHLGNKTDTLHESMSEDVLIYPVNSEDTVGIGSPVRSFSDAMGLTRLQKYMSEQDFARHRSWVADGAKVNGVYQLSKAMSPAALDRAEAILTELQEQGTPFTIEREREVGQLAAKISGTGISVRITDTRENEHMVGRTYDDGVVTQFSTTKGGNSQGSYARVMYTDVTPDEAVDLMRVTQGLPVKRRDIDAPLGQQRHHRTNDYNPRTRRPEPGIKHDTYSTREGSLSMIYKDLNNQGDKVRILRNAKYRSSTATFFENGTAAEEYLRSAVDSARENYVNAIDIDAMVASAADHLTQPDENLSFEYSSNPEVAAIQRGYWDVLTGVQRTLMVPGTEDADVPSVYSADELAERYGANDLDTLDQATLIVREHAADLAQTTIGSFDVSYVDGEPRRFDPAMVGAYMASNYGLYRNHEDIVQAVRTADINPDELYGDAFDNKILRDRMISFDSTSAVELGGEGSSSFMQSMRSTIEDSLMRAGVEPPRGQDRISIQIDAQGLVRYEGVRAVTEKAQAPTPVIGEIGQFFEPGEYGQVVTAFGSGDNYMFSPGYTATVAAQKPGENRSLEERTILHGYEQMMRQAVSYRIANDMLSAPREGAVIGTPTSVNNVYRQLSDVRHPVDFLERSAQEGLSEDLQRDILLTESSRVRYGNDLKSGSTVNAEYRAEHSVDIDPDNDNFSDAYRLTGGRNMAIITEESSGYFDAVATSGGTNQGIVRYLVQSASVDENGRIIKGREGDKCALMNNPVMRYQEFNTADRSMMTFNNVLQGAAVTEPIRTAQMTFGGWTMDDPIVVSQRFADTHLIRNPEGHMRPLKVGDKISDLNGNKGVIGLVVDPAMSEEVAEEKGILEPVRWFAANPEMDVVMAPFSAVSRFNGGSYRELSENTLDLTHPDTGEKIPGGTLGACSFVITHLDVEKKTSIYDAEAVAEGKGRNASSQLMWGLGAQGADKVAASFFSSNSGAMVNLREKLMVLGMDMDEYGNFREEYSPHEGEDRRIFNLQELKYIDRKGTAIIDINGMRKDFNTAIEHSGGFMELPFPLKTATGKLTPVLSESGGDFGSKTYRLPLMSSYLRSGRQTIDGTAISHDYTNRYLSIADESNRYRDFEAKLKSGVDNKGVRLTQKAKDDLQEKMDKSIIKAQASYSSMAHEILERDMSGKHNMFKESIMSKRQPKSATAVWTGDPRLGIDEISVSPKIADALGKTDDDHIMVFRDPILRDSGIRYMRVKIDPELTGCAINPAMAGPFDGDFDGDSVGLMALDDSVHIEAMQKLSVPMNLLDQGSLDDKGRYPLAMNNTLDAKVSAHENPALARSWEELTDAANAAHSDFTSGEITAAELFDRNSDIVQDINAYYDEAIGCQFGDAVISYSDMGSHMESLRRSCIETGAKGSESKLQMYAQQLGASEANGQWLDSGITGATQEGIEGVQLATAIKSHGTGIAGKYSQRGVLALRDSELKAVLELTYPATQAILQAKHDPVEAKVKYDVLMSSSRDLWRGHLLEKTLDDSGKPHWKPVKDEKGRTMQATKEQWLAQLDDIYKDKNGMNLPDYNPENAVKIADALVDVDGKMRNIEDVDNGFGTTLDQLAYSNVRGADKIGELMNMASSSRNLFEGELNKVFAPHSIRSNVADLKNFEKSIESEADYVSNLKPVLKRDTQMDGSRISARRSSMVRSTGGERDMSDVPAGRASRLGVKNRPMAQPDKQSADQYFDL